MADRAARATARASPDQPEVSLREVWGSPDVLCAESLVGVRAWVLGVRSSPTRGACGSVFGVSGHMHPWSTQIE